MRSVKEYEEGNRKSIELQRYGDFLRGIKVIKLIEYDLWLQRLMDEEENDAVDQSVNDNEMVSKEKSEFPF